MAAQQELGKGPAPAFGDDVKDEGETLLAYGKEPPATAATAQQSPLVRVVASLPALLSAVAVIVMLYALQDTLSNPERQGTELVGDAASVVAPATDQGALQSAKQEMQKLRKQLRMAAKQARNFQVAAKVSQAQVAQLKTALAEAQAQPGNGKQTVRLGGGKGTGAGAGDDAQLEALLGVHSGLQDCPKSAVANASAACRLAQAVLRSALERAEEQYVINIRNRNMLGPLLTNPHMPRVRLKEALMVPTWPCPLEGRFGLWGEGGKWACLVHSGVTQRPMTISVGSRGDVSFESEMYVRLNATIHTLDPTLDTAQQKRMRTIPYLTFHNAGLSGKNEIRSTLAHFPPAFRKSVLLTVPQLFRALNVTYIDVFKIDCEGCEYGVVEDMVRLYDRTTVPFGQILMEIHFIHESFLKARDLMASLEGLGYRMFHAEPNAYYASGYEMAYIHESLTRV